MIEKEKQTRAKNTHAVKCPHCGEVNIITSQTGTCKYCRNKNQGTVSKTVPFVVLLLYWLSYTVIKDKKGPSEEN